jgi:hypothetical protein
MWAPAFSLANSSAARDSIQPAESREHLNLLLNIRPVVFDTPRK